MFPLSSKEYKLAIEIVKLSHKNFKNYGIGLRMVGSMIHNKKSNPSRTLPKVELTFARLSL